MSRVSTDVAPRAVPLTPALIAQLVREFRRKVEGHSAGQPPGAPRVFAIRSTAPWAGPARVDVDGQPLDVVAAVSALHVRELLSSRAAGSPDLLVMTGLADEDLGKDVLSRLAMRRLASVELWPLVLEAFRARDVDARLVKHRWMAQALLEAMPDGGYPAVPAGVLDSSTAWQALLEGRLGLPAQPDAVALLEWAADAGRVERLRQVSDEVRTGVRDWTSQHLGEVAPAILDAAAAGHDTLALGLVCDVVFEERSPPGRGFVARVDARDAAIRLEPLVGGRPLSPRAGVAWGRAAVALLTRPRDARQPGPWRGAVDAADRVLTQLLGERLAIHSDLLQRGFDQRCEQMAAAMVAYLKTGTRDARDAAHDARERLLRHRLATLATGRERVDRLEMALRLARWLHERADDLPGSVAHAAWAQVRQDGLADWARGVGRSTDQSTTVADACSAVLEAVRAAVARRQDHFATLLRDWLELNTDLGSLVMERVLDARVAPLAAHAPVLLLVMDGMSAGTCLELAQSLVDDGWIALAPEGQETPEPVLSLLPSVTAVCRTSLLSGRIAQGTQADETRHFGTHPALLAHSLATHPPLLFHKAELTEDHGALPTALRDAIRSPKTRVVGIVVNAIDDHLLKADQVRSRWSLSDVPILPGILHEARNAGRIVILASDHGHVLDDRSSKQSGGSADRWRAVEPAPREGEVLVRGPRVVAPGHACILAVSEQLRYQTKKNGYHGGGSPQEVVAPLVVLTRADADIPGWRERALPAPDWWTLAHDDASVPALSVAHVPAPARSKATRPLLPLMEDDVVVAGPAPVADLAATLVGSGIYLAQKAQQARATVPDERVQAVVSLLLARGGRATRVAMASALGLPAGRLGLQLNAIRGLLNIEGYAVLSIDEASDTVTLNRDYLVSQFDLH